MALLFFDLREMMQRTAHGLLNPGCVVNVCVLLKFKEEPTVIGLKCHKEVAAENPIGLE